MEAELENYVPLMQPSRGFEELKKLVVDQNICSGCSTCAAFCERIELKDGKPELVKDCNMEIGAIKCSIEGTCYDCCPMVSFSKPRLEEEVFGANREDEDIGYYKKIVAVRSKKKEILEKAQDGGGVTSLLAAGLEAGLIEGASVASRNQDWSTGPIIAKNEEELLECAGTKYSQTPTVMKFGGSLKDVRKLALVGTGCQTMGARKASRIFLKELLEITAESETPVELTLIGLFCFENFPYSCISKVIEKEFNVKMEDIVKTDITKGKFTVTTKKGEELKVPVKTFNECVPGACELCINFTSELADISCGSVGTDAGWSTVIVRSDKGLKLLEKAVEMGYLETKDQVDLSQIKKNVSLKKDKRKAVAEEREKEGKYVPEYGQEE